MFSRSPVFKKKHVLPFSCLKKTMFFCSPVSKKTCSHVLLSLKNHVLPSKNNFFQKKFPKHLAVSNKSTTFALALKN